MCAEKPSEIQEFSHPTVRREMPLTAAIVADELTTKIKDVVKSEPQPSVKARLRAVARRIGLSAGRIEDYWYGEVRCPPAHEADQIRAYYEAAHELIEAKKAYEKRRENLLRDRPNLARFLPAALGEDEISLEAATAAASEFAKINR